MTGQRPIAERLAYAREELAGAEAALEAANAGRQRAREEAGGLASFGGSGPQRAAGQVRSSTSRALDAVAAAQGHVDRWRDRVASYERRLAEQERKPLTRDDVLGATHVRTRTGWHEVVRVNQKTVTVATAHSWTDAHPFERILAARTITKGTA